MEQVIDAADEVAFEAADRLGVGLAGAALLSEVGGGLGVEHDLGEREHVEGVVELAVAAGVQAVAVKSPHILNAKGATYAQSADWGVEEAEGFIKLFGMSSTLYAQINGADAGVRGEE